jgi:hypothetical protein
MRPPITATRSFSLGLSAARVYAAAERVRADAARNVRRVGVFMVERGKGNRAGYMYAVVEIQKRGPPEPDHTWDN